MQPNVAILAHDPDTGRVINVKPIFDLKVEFGSTSDISKSLGDIIDFMAQYTDFKDFSPTEFSLCINTAIRLRDTFKVMTELESIKTK